MNTRYGVFLDENSWVELQGTMPIWSADDPNVLDRAVVQAARTSYLGESKGDDRDKKLLKYLYRNRHTSPFEMVEFKFRIRAPLVVRRVLMSNEWVKFFEIMRSASQKQLTLMYQKREYLNEDSKNSFQLIQAFQKACDAAMMSKNEEYAKIMNKMFNLE